MSTAEDLMRQYFARLEAATAALPHDVRAEVLADVGAHLGQVLADDPTEAEARQALDRLGTAEAIAAATGSDWPDGTAHGTVRQAATEPVAPELLDRSGVRALDVVTILLLAAGVPLALAVVGPLGLAVWMAAVVLLWRSPAWTRGEKTVATLVWPGGVAFPIQMIMVLETVVCPTSVVQPMPFTLADGSVVAGTVTTCEGFAVPLWLGAAFWVTVYALPVVVGIMLLRRAHWRGAAPARVLARSR